MSIHYLFSYGTLQQRDVQMANFGRVLEGSHDVLNGFQIAHVEITDANVLAQSGLRFHPILRPSNNPNESVTGTVFAVTLQDIERADSYEVDDYHRIKVTLRSGKAAWVYVERGAG